MGKSMGLQLIIQLAQLRELGYVWAAQVTQLSELCNIRITHTFYRSAIFIMSLSFQLNVPDNLKLSGTYPTPSAQSP